MQVCATGGIEDGLKVVVKSTLTRALKSVFIRATSHPCSSEYLAFIDTGTVNSLLCLRSE